MVFPLWGLFVGIVLYISLYVSPKMSGDIGNLAFIPFGLDYDQYMNRKTIKDTLFTTINSTNELKSIKTTVLTIGDSFSQQINRGYQNYISSEGINVINCKRSLYGSPIQYAYNILDKNLLDSSNVKVLVVECVERGFYSEAKNFDKTKIEHEVPKGPQEANEWSIQRARDFIFYQIKLNSPIYKAHLDKNYFSSEEPNILYFYHEDIDLDNHIVGQQENDVRYMFEILNNKAKEKGIFLILLIAVDKYDLYQRHIVDNDYPDKTINTDIQRILGKSEHILISKDYLLPMIENGEKDIFLFNDTHWSYKAAKVIGNEIAKRTKKIIFRMEE